MVEAQARGGCPIANEPIESITVAFFGKFCSHQFPNGDIVVT